MKKSYFLLNNKIISSAKPAFCTNNRAFRYGDSIFESIRLINGNPVFLEDHLNRIVKGMKIMKMNIPSFFTIKFLKEQINKTTLYNNINDGGRVRLTVFRNDGGLYAPVTNDISYLLEAYKIKEPCYAINKRGLTVDIYAGMKKPLNELSNLKTGNALHNVLAGIYKNEKGLDDCILLNSMGNVAEAISSNIFIVKNKKLFTPPLTQGCVEGVMRKTILRLASGEGIVTEEFSLKPDDLLTAGEFFLTNAIQGIIWVGNYRSKSYKNHFSQKLFDLLKAFSNG